VAPSGVHRRHFLAALAASGLLPRPLPRWRSVDEMYALVLGSVQDAGLPQVGCYTELCDLGRTLLAEGRGRFVSSLAIVEPVAERFYLVDAEGVVIDRFGPQYRQFDLPIVDGLVAGTEAGGVAASERSLRRIDTCPPTFRARRASRRASARRARGRGDLRTIRTRAADLPESRATVSGPAVHRRHLG